MSAIEDGDFSDSELAMLRKQWQSTPQSPAPRPQPPLIGLTGTRGPGTSPGSAALSHPFPSPFPPMSDAANSILPPPPPPPRAPSGGPTPYSPAHTPHLPNRRT